MKLLIQESGVSLSLDRPPFFLEVCAGSAKLSFSLMNRNIQVLAVDYDKNRHTTWVPIVILDLSDSEQCSILLELIESGVVDVLFLALPCGTCSRAREIPLLHGNGPKPLRTETSPWGVDNLHGKDLERLLKANTIYSHCLVLIAAQRVRGKDVIIENPSRSILWFIPPFAELLNLGFSDVEFQHCKWTPERASRDKWTRLRSTIPGLSVLSGKCHMPHKHLPWGRAGSTFATSEEAEYPAEMCEALANELCNYFLALGFPALPPKTNMSIADAPHHKRRRAAANKQPRGRKLPPLVSEFKTVLSLPTMTPISDWHKLLRYEVQRGVEDNAAAERTSRDQDSVDMFPIVGIYRTPEEFIEDAVLCTHPVDSQFGVPDVLKRTIHDHIVSTTSESAQKQVFFLRSLAKFVHDSKQEELALRETFDTFSCNVTRDKAFLAIQWLLGKHSAEWPDSKLFDDLVAGFKLTGMQPHTGVFDFEPDLPTMTVSQLRATSEVQNKVLLKRTKSSGDNLVDVTLWEQAKDEVSKGWLVGPFDDLEHLSQQTSIVGPHVSRRFPVIQSNKVRAIDDLKESQVNCTYGKCDKLWLMDIDSIVSMIRLIEQLISGAVDVLHFDRGDSYNIKSPLDEGCQHWVGCTFDLHAAYKQLHVHPNDRWASVVSLFSPEDNTAKIFAQVVLPFGASASVISFNRIARFMWFLGCVELGIVWANFFDDFPVLCRKDLASVSLKSIELMFKLLGWQIAEGDKAASFSELFSALGVQFDVRDISNRRSFVQNTQKRLDSIQAGIKQILDRGVMSTSEAESLRGRLQFMEAGFFGRLGKSVIMSISVDRNKDSRLLPSDVLALKAVGEWLSLDCPRLVSPFRESKGCLLFTDGACEGLDHDIPNTSIGAVMINLDSGERFLFGNKLSDELVLSWVKTTNKKQLVTEAEMFAVLVSFRLWFEHFKNNKLVIFVDSEPTMFSFIRGASNSEVCNDIVRKFFLLHGKSHCFQWIARVPTKSNPADLPSRLRLQEAAVEYSADIVSIPDPNFV
jgi:hypothetical protein